MAEPASPVLITTSLLSSGIAGVVSVIYFILCTIGLVYHFDCENDIDSLFVDNSKYFWNLIYATYLRTEECGFINPNLTRSYTVLVFLGVTLALSIVTLASSIILSANIIQKRTQHCKVYVYIFISVWVANLVVDVTLGTLFGLDINYLSEQMDNVSYYDIQQEILRQGAFYLMSVALKGYVLHAIQVVLICIILVHLEDGQDEPSKDEYGMHIRPPINAFDQSNGENYQIAPLPRGQPYNLTRLDENFIKNTDYQMGPLPRGHLRNSPDDNQRMAFAADSRGPGSYRSDSWNRGNPLPSTSNTLHPFSYLEEPRAIPVASPQVPRVPAPDYTPQGHRKLKSALKSNFSS